jgi:transcriptional regulator with XRE-family HTH domain
VAAEEAKRESRQVNGVGPSGRQVAQNVARIRSYRSLTTVQLSKLLAEVGRPITPSSITKIELGQRQVNVDDLIALAVVLGVNPSALLIPNTLDGEVEITAVGVVNLVDAWDWLDGYIPVEIPEDDDGSAVPAFQLAARPPGKRRFTVQQPPAE